MRKPLFISLLVVILLSGFILIGINFSGSVTQAADKASQLPPIKIGHILDLTGPEAVIGGVFKSSLEFAFESINYQIAGRKVEIVIGDAQGKPNTAVDVARKMVENDKVDAIFGPTQAGEKMAVAGYIKQAHIPMFIYVNAPIVLFTGSNKWLIGTYGSDIMMSSCMGDYLYNHLNYKKISTLTQDNAGGRAFVNPVTDYFKKTGGQIVQQQWVPIPCPDFASYLTTLKPADVLLAWTAGADAIKLLSQYHQLSIDKKMPLMGAFHGGFLDNYIVAAMAPVDAAAIVDKALCPMMYAPDSKDPANQAFVKIWSSKMGFPPPDDAASGPYTAALVFAEAVKINNGDTTPAKLLEATNKVKLTGPEGPLTFPKGLMVAQKNVYILKVVKTPKGYAYSTVYTYKNVYPTGYTGK